MPQALIDELQNSSAFILGPKKRKEACFLTKGEVLLPSSTNRNNRKVPSRYLKCRLISEGMLYFTACDLLEHLNLKNRREQQTETKHCTRNAVCGGLFWFVCWLLQTDGNNSLSSFSDSSWPLLITTTQLNFSL